MIRVKEYKSPQHDRESEKFLSPEKLIIPLTQNTGKPSLPLVKSGSQVRQGEAIAEPGGFVSSYIHASCGGKVTAVEAGPHPIFKRSQCVYLQCAETKPVYEPHRNRENLSNEELLDIIKKAGIVGMGGACFPAQVKLAPPEKIETLLINGCECEPYLSCDNRLMVEQAKGIFQGVELICRILEPQRVVFCIEENKPQAIKRFNRYISTRRYDLPPAELKIFKSRYPQGGERQLIYQALRKKVPAGGIPFEVGCVVHNVGTCFAVYEAVYMGKPLIERLVTFAGDCLSQPRNLWLKTGTLVSELFQKKILEFKKEPKKIIFGGPMMGIAVDSTDYPVLKGTSGVLFLSQDQIDRQQEQSCIRCARCVDACPMNLLPLEYVKKVKAGRYEELEQLFIKDCIECGCCSHVCPAKIPIVHYIKRGKSNAAGN